MRLRGEAVLGAGCWVLWVALLALALWPPVPRPAEILRTYSHAPSAVERDSLAALAANGTVVRWRGSIPAVAMEVDRDPVTAAVRVAVASAEGSRVRVTDALGVLESTE